MEQIKMKRKTAKELLAETFRELAAKKNIDKITVRDVVENCGYSTATFYRHFKDKYDLIAWDYTRDIEKLLDRSVKARRHGGRLFQMPQPIMKATKDTFRICSSIRPDMIPSFGT